MGLLQDILDSQFKDAHEKAKRKQSGIDEPSLLGAFKDPQFRQDVKRGLLDSLNRGAVASTIGGPVDLATLALRPLGYNVEKPVLGSEWVGDKMQQMGLLGDTRNPIAEAIASVAVPGAMTKAGQGLFKAEQAAIKNAQIAGPLSDSRLASQRGVFGGINAKTADKAKLAQAEQMLNKGVDPAQVWKETGWGRGPDGKWRFEIPDKQAKIDMGAFDDVRSNPDWNPNADTFPMGGVLEHKKLYKAYPDAADIQTHFLPDSSMKGSSGAYSPAHDRVTLGQGLQKDKAKSFTLHELQHAIQQREGFARGGSPENYNQQDIAEKARDLLSWRKDVEAQIAKNPGMDWAKAEQAAIKEYKDIGWPEGIPSDEVRKMAVNPSEYFDSPPQDFVSLYGLDKRTTPYSGNDLYRRLGGEAEARLVQSRMNLTPEERAAQYPWDADYFKQQTGVGLDDLIHRFDGGEAKSVGFTYPQDAALETARQNGVKMLGLPENNTPMDRARALGFDTDVYHGSPNFNGDGFSRFESGHRGASGNETAKIGTWVTDSPSTANDFAKIENAGTETRINPETGDLLRWEDGEPRRFWYDQTGGVLPLKVRGKDFTEFSSPAGGDPFEQFMDYRDKYAKYISGDSWRKHYINTNPQEANAGLISDISAQGKKGAAIRGTGYDANDGQKIDQYVVTDPSAIRSRFAAFDPARINENDLLAGAMPFGLLLDPDNRAKLGVK